MGLIRLDYVEVRAAANKFISLARQGEECSHAMNGLASQIPSYWRGDAADAFVSICLELQQEVRDLAHRLESIGYNLRAVAREIREAEKRVQMVVQGK